MPIAFYVYYRIDPRQEAVARERIGQLMDRVERACGVRGRLLTKQTEPALWMEVYERVPDAAGFESALNAACAASGVDAVLRSVRNVERFCE